MFDFFRTKWEAWADCNISEENKAKEYSAFISIVDHSTYSQIQAMALPDDKRKNVREILDRFEQNLKPMSTFIDRARFHQMVQQQGQPFDEYYSELRSAHAKCKFRECCKGGDVHMTCSEETLLARLVVGLKDAQLRNALLSNDKLTLDDAILQCRKHESLRSESSRLDSAGTIARVKNNRRRFNQRGKKLKNISTDNSDESDDEEDCIEDCRFCAKSHKRNRKLFCRAFNSTCAKCLEVGHWAVKCPENKPSQSTSNSNTVGRITCSSRPLRINQISKVSPPKKVGRIFQRVPLELGDNVAVQSRSNPKQFDKGILIAKLPYSRYKVQLADGSMSVRYSKYVHANDNSDFSFKKSPMCQKIFTSPIKPLYPDWYMPIF